MRLQDRTILITGGTSGIGLEQVRQLIVSNTIIVVSRSSAGLDRLAKEFPSIAAYQCCLTDGSKVKQTISDVIRDFHRVSVVINNAGIQKTPSFLDESFCYDEIEDEVKVNLVAPIKICALMLRHFLALNETSAFVNISSGLALFPKKTSAVYCATKAAIHNFSRSFRYQLEETDIRVHEAILPLVDTPMTEGRHGGKISAPKAASEIISGIEKARDEIYIGRSRLIPTLARLSPSLMAKIMKS